MHPINVRLTELGLVLPDPPQPAGRYQPVVRSKGLLFLSGQFPFWNGELRYRGQVGRDLSVEDGRQAARLAALNVLAHVRRATGDWNELGELVRVEGHVSSATGWHGQAAVLDGASGLFSEVLGLQAGHARTAFSACQLPLNAAVELVVVASIADRNKDPLEDRW
jgi:enamine deaminase RidA (YjgF/YER057c/UK114 family)